MTTQEAYRQLSDSRRRDLEQSFLAGAEIIDRLDDQAVSDAELGRCLRAKWQERIEAEVSRLCGAGAIEATENEDGERWDGQE